MKIILSIVLLVLSCTLTAQQKTKGITGKLFIIGGGDRPPSLMRWLAQTAALKATDYVVVLPMAGGQPDTSFYYFKEDWRLVSDAKICNFNFTNDNVNDESRIDSLKKAKLIFITGGDQDRFMKTVLNTPVTGAIEQAYKDGATVAGTSAGAAVMSKWMITGNQLTDTVYRPTFKKLVTNNIEFKPGLGLISGAIIDQHFVVRSRYNRLLSALAAHPTLTGIGIDEETAVIVEGNTITVAGGGQVIVMKNPRNFSTTKEGLIRFSDIDFSIYTEGNKFFINTKAN